MDSPQISLGAVTMEAADPQLLATFWAAVTGSEPVPMADQLYVPAPTPDGLAFFFQPLTGPRPARSTTHLDLTVPWPTRQSEVERLESLGATRQWDVLDEHPHVRWTTMADPEGNLFCVAEHPPTGS